MEITKESSAEPKSDRKEDGPPPEPGGTEPAIGYADALGEHVQNPPEARTEGRKLFEPDGPTHVVAPLENRIKGQFELWVQNNALRAIAQMEEIGNPDRTDRMMSAYIADHGAGHYTWDGKHVRNAYLTGMPGFCHLLYLLMARCNPKLEESKVLDLMRKYPRQCGELLRWALGNSQAPADTGASNGTVGQRFKQAAEQAAKTPATLD